MSHKFQLIILLSAYLLYANAMQKPTTPSIKRRTSAPSVEEKGKIISTPKDFNKSPFKKSKSRDNTLKKAAKSVEQQQLPFEVPGTPNIDEVGVVPTMDDDIMELEKGIAASVSDNSIVPQMASPPGHHGTVSMESEETKDVASSSAVDVASAEEEAMDPKSQHAELLEMNDTLQWELAVRSEDAQVLDRRGDLAWFPSLIFHKLDNFLHQVPTGDGANNAQQKAELANMVANWKEQQQPQPIDVDQEMVQIFEIENSLDKFTDELHEQNMPSVKASPAILDIVLDITNDETHEEQKLAFLWKVVNRKPTRYVKNVGQFFGGISVAMAYLHQTLKVGNWALENHFIAPEQLLNLTNVVHENVAKLDAIQKTTAAKMGINLGDIGINQLLAEQMPSLKNIFTRNLAENLTKIKQLAQLEQVPFNDAQIGTLFVLNALIAANGEVEQLEDEIVGLQLTWPVFQAVGDVSKAANALQKMQI